MHGLDLVVVFCAGFVLGMAVMVASGPALAQLRHEKAVAE